MKRYILKAAAVGWLLFAPSIAAAAASGFATANVNMRSGPSTSYPAVVVVPAGAPITVNGCLSNVNWCDVTFARGRGWVSGNYIQTTYRQNRVYVAPEYYRPLGIPTITFDVDTYWNRYYRNRDFYSERGRWRDWDYRRDYDRAPPPPPPQRWDDRRSAAPPPPPPPPRWDDNRPPSRWEDRRPNPEWDGGRYRGNQQNRDTDERDRRRQMGGDRPPEQDRRPPPPAPQPQQQQPRPAAPPPPPPPAPQQGQPGGQAGCAPPQPCFFLQQQQRDPSH